MGNKINRERKFTAPPESETLALELFESHCFLDDKYPTNVINSIYYDSRFIHFYSDKLEGHFLKMKVRLRWYDDEGKNISPGSQLKSFIEIKDVGAKSHFMRSRVCKLTIRDLCVPVTKLLHIAV